MNKINRYNKKESVATVVAKRSYNPSGFDFDDEHVAETTTELDDVIEENGMNRTTDQKIALSLLSLSKNHPRKEQKSIEQTQQINPKHVLKQCKTCLVNKKLLRNQSVCELCYKMKNQIRSWGWEKSKKNKERKDSFFFLILKIIDVACPDKTVDDKIDFTIDIEEILWVIKKILNSIVEYLRRPMTMISTR